MRHRGCEGAKRSSSRNLNLLARCVACFRARPGVRVAKASAGEQHTALVSDDGHLFLFGNGMAMLGAPPPPVDATGATRDTATAPAHQLADREELEQRAIERISERLRPTGVPREPSASWLPSLAGQTVDAVACGGQRVVVLSSGEHIGRTLRQTLWKQALKVTAAPHADDSDTDSDATESASPAVAAGADMVLIVAGRPLYAHRVVLARRSVPLRELIAQEERPGDDGLLELLLPELNYEVARALLEFMYSDNLRTPLDQMLLYDLLSTADAYQLPRLVRVFLFRPPLRSSTPPTSRLLVCRPPPLTPSCPTSHAGRHLSTSPRH